jgi:hypothetical protein
MPKWDPDTLTDRQRAWFASVRDGLARDTGKDLEAWTEIALTCPQTAHRARLKWFKDVHGLGQNRAAQVLAAAFPTPEPDDDGADPLWSDAGQAAIYQAAAALALALPGVKAGRRKAFSPFSRNFQFAALSPSKTDGVRLGLALPPDASPRLAPPKRESWSERLKAVVALGSVEAVDGEIEALLRAAWEGS